MKSEQDLVSEFKDILNKRKVLPPEKANKLVPLQKMLENAIISQFGVMPFIELLGEEDDHILLQSSFVILESDKSGEKERKLALKKMREISNKTGNASFSAHMYLKRKGLL